MNKKMIKRIPGILLFFGLVLFIIGAIQELKTLHQDINIVLLSGAVCLSLGILISIKSTLQEDKSSLIRNLFIITFVILGLSLVFVGIIQKKMYFFHIGALTLAFGGAIRTITNNYKEKS